MQLIQSDLAKIGIKTKLDGHEWAEYTSSFLKQEKGAFVKSEGQQLMRLGWVGDYPIIDNFTYPLVPEHSRRQQGPLQQPRGRHTTGAGRGRRPDASRLHRALPADREDGRARHAARAHRDLHALGRDERPGPRPHLQPAEPSPTSRRSGSASSGTSGDSRTHRPGGGGATRRHRLGSLRDEGSVRRLLKYIVRRILQMIPVFFGVTVAALHPDRGRAR